MRIAVVVAAWVALACGGDGPTLYEGRGVVEEIYRDEAQVVIAHDDISGLMPAMTMNFAVERRALLDPLEPGQRIAFTLSFNGRDYRIVSVRVLGLGGASGKAGSAGSSGAAPGAAEVAPPFSLTDQDGNTVALENLRGKAVLLEFIFTRCPGPCPILTGLHVDVQRALPVAAQDGVRFVSISIDPVHDTPEVLRAYAEARGADLERWSFLTGPEEQVAEVVRAYGVGTIRKADGEIDHQIVTYLIDAGGNVAGRYLGSGQTVEELTEVLVALAPQSPAVGAAP